MRFQGVRLVGAAFFALLLVGFAAPALAAGGDCREECTEARATCHVAAHTAHRICHEACSESDAECWRTCAQAATVARALCAAERLECRMACRPGPDCDCVAGCGVDLRECRRDLYGCLDECRERTQDALEGCRDLAQGGAPPAELRACVVEAERAGHECGLICRGVLRCGGRFVRCAQECRDQP